MAIILAAAACGGSTIAPNGATYVMTGTVSGDAAVEGRTVAGASVRVLEASVQGSPTVTDANGNYRLPALLNGRHLIEVTKPGFVVWETEFLISDHDMTLNVLLQAADSPATARD